MAKLTRRCNKCKEEKELREFPKRKDAPFKKGYKCKPCCVIDQRKLYTKEEISIKNKRAMMKMKYGLTLEQLDQMKVNQGNKCKICKEEVELVVDHCHLSGRVRGLLCRQCNTGIGMLKDNLLLLKSAQEYLANE